MDEDSNAHSFLDSFFDNPPEQKKSLYYARSPYVSNRTPLKISDIHASCNKEGYNCDQSPVLYLNDSDDFIPPEEFAYVDDYAIVVSSDSNIKSFYSQLALDIIWDDNYTSDNNIRGLCDTCRSHEGDSIDVPSYKSNVLRCGYEIIKAWPDGHKGTVNATLAIQSRSDALYVFASGDYEDYEWDPPPVTTFVDFIDNYVTYHNGLQVESIGPFGIPEDPHGEFITPQEWATSGLMGETKWLLTNPECLLLNDASHAIWRNELIHNGPLDAIMGFKVFYLSPPVELYWFFRDVVEKLWNTSHNHNLWSCYIPADIAVTNWMEQACLYAREGGEYSIFEFASAVDSGNRYYIDYGRNRLSPELPRNFFIYEY